MSEQRNFDQNIASVLHSPPYRILCINLRYGLRSIIMNPIQTMILFKILISLGAFAAFAAKKNWKNGTRNQELKLLKVRRII